MWYNDFADRLESWSELRTTCAKLPIEDALRSINEWWLRTPWTAHYLHWDDIDTWPDDLNDLAVRHNILPFQCLD